jgi:Cd2+/Zn2+-exporting ATPase
MNIQTYEKGGTMKYILKGLDCPNCAAKIETKVNSLKDVKYGTLSFATQTLEIELHGNVNQERVVNEIKSLIKDLEPDVEVLEKTEEKQDEEEGHSKIELVKIIVSAILFAIGIIFEFGKTTELVIFLSSYIIIGYEIIFKAIKNIFKGDVFDENFLMTIATIGAFGIGEFHEAVAVMLLYNVGEFLQDKAVEKSRKSITKLMDIRPDYANLKTEGGINKVSPSEICVGDEIIVKPGEKIPLDGIILEGESLIDTSALTGESVPRNMKEENEILSGMINKTGVLTVKVTKTFENSTVSKILELVQNASNKKAHTEKFITKFARIYTPIVVLLAVLIVAIPTLFIKDALFSDWLYKALVFLVISCPCALVISIPLSFFSGIGGASKRGILVKGANYLEILNKIDTVVFDKTGTLTKGVFNVTEIVPVGEISKEELLEHCAYAESYSNHPIATSIVKAYGKDIDKSKIKGYTEISGNGIKASVNWETVLVGNSKLMIQEKIKYEEKAIIGTVVHVAIEGKYKGYIVISDVIKEDSKSAIKGLKQLGIKNTVMLTGDTKQIAEHIGEEIGIDKVVAELLPVDKVEELEKCMKDGKVVFVGDGINDSPVLARADVGIAMGGIGSDSAIEASDVVIMTDEPSKIVTAIKIARKTRKIVIENIVLAIVVKLAAMTLGVFGIATIWEAVIADVGVTIIAVINSIRALQTKRS